MSTVFLWPRPDELKARHFLNPARINTEDIESRLRDLFPATEPVLFSSARAALNAILEHLGCSRPDQVWCPPFSSHCVFDAVSRIATPITRISSDIRVALIYHQWGYVHTHDFPSDVEIIEDAVDTLFYPGTNPLAINGRFSLWSLPKTIASQFGGVIFCRARQDAAALRRLRNSRTIPTTLQALLRILSERHPVASAYWHGAEAKSGLLPQFALRQIGERLEKLQSLVEARRTRASLIAPYSLFPYADMSRLPSNIPVRSTTGIQDFFAPKGNFSAGIRHINAERCATATEWKKAAPIPIHATASDSVLAEVINQLRRESASS